jgi:hypothetical protein
MSTMAIVEGATINFVHHLQRVRSMSSFCFDAVERGLGEFVFVAGVAVDVIYIHNPIITAITLQPISINQSASYQSSIVTNNTMSSASTTTTTTIVPVSTGTGNQSSSTTSGGGGNAGTTINSTTTTTLMSKIRQRQVVLPPTIAQLYGRTLWDPTPTTTTKSQKQLAYALGYPIDWRVERSVEVDDETGQPRVMDRIHATGGKKNQIKYMWLHHEAAQRAALQLEQEGTLAPIVAGAESGGSGGGGTTSTTTTSKANSSNSSNINATGSHLLPPTPLYNKGDIVQVLYEGSWWEATITKRKKQADSFLYGVKYDGDDTLQNDVEEENIRAAESPSELAVSLGFTSDWRASRKGPRYLLSSPTGETFTNKKAAMKVFRELQGKLNPTTNHNNNNDDDDVGDPPWRLSGHELIGREVVWTFEHKASATRKITIEQVGIVVGYIDAKDKDKVRHGHGCGRDLFRLCCVFFRSACMFTTLYCRVLSVSHSGTWLLDFHSFCPPPPPNPNPTILAFRMVSLASSRRLRAVQQISFT